MEVRPCFADRVVSLIDAAELLSRRTQFLWRRKVRLPAHAVSWVRYRSSNMQSQRLDSMYAGCFDIKR